MSDIYVRPIRPVWDPEHKDLLPVNGRHVPPTPYWLRRIKCGSVATDKVKINETKRIK